MVSLATLFQKPTAKVLDKSDPSIVFQIKGGGSLCIEKSSGRLFKLSFCEANVKGEYKLKDIGVINIDKLKESVSGFCGCIIGSAVIKTRLGDFEMVDRKHIRRLRRWLKQYE